MSKKVLIIEDEVDIREAILEALQEANLEVITAENGSIGLQKALAEKPDIILLDIIMPIMGGHETLKKLRQDPWGSTAKVVMLTSMDDVKNVADAHEGDISDYIIKSHKSLDEIVKAVRLEVFTE